MMKMKIKELVLSQEAKKQPKLKLKKNFLNLKKLQKINQKKAEEIRKILQNFKQSIIKIVQIISEKK